MIRLSHRQTHGVPIHPTPTKSPKSSTGESQGDQLTVWNAFIEQEELSTIVLFLCSHSAAQEDRWGRSFRMPPLRLCECDGLRQFRAGMGRQDAIGALAMGRHG